MFRDREVQYPGRVKATDVNTSDEYTFDIVRDEGTVTEEGTPLDREGFDKALQSYIDIGQTSSDYIADNWGTATGVTLSNKVSGYVKYAAAGDSTVVIVKLVVATALSGDTELASISATGTAPSQDLVEQVRNDERVTVKYTTAGKLMINGDYAVGTQIFTAFEF